MIWKESGWHDTLDSCFFLLSYKYSNNLPGLWCGLASKPAHVLPNHIHKYLQPDLLSHLLCKMMGKGRIVCFYFSLCWVLISLSFPQMVLKFNSNQTSSCMDGIFFSIFLQFIFGVSKNNNRKACQMKRNGICVKKEISGLNDYMRQS